MNKAVILAGGVRSGLELGGAQVPRALWPLGPEPLIAGVIRFLVRSGIEQIAICANGKTRLIASELARGRTPWNNLHYSEDVFPRGPAGCLKDLEDWLGADPFVAIQGTAWYDFDLQAMADHHRQSAAAITLGATADGPGAEHDPLAPAGVYVMNPAVLALLNKVGYQDIKEQLLPRVREAGMAMAVHRIAGRVRLIHGPDHYLDALAEYLPLANRAGMADYSEIRPGVLAHGSARISEGVRINGPAWIGPEARIGCGAVLLGPVLLGEGVSVGDRAVLKRAAVMAGAQVEAGAVVLDTVMPPRDRAGAPQVTRVVRSKPIEQRKPALGLMGQVCRTLGLGRASGRIGLGHAW